MKTAQQIDDLKAQWEADPCWDIADTEGFEARREELQQYQLQKEQYWERRARTRQLARANHLGCSVETLLLLESLERRIAKLEAKLEGSYQS